MSDGFDIKKLVSELTERAQDKLNDYVDETQAEIDRLTQKAIAQEPFEEREKLFLLSLYKKMVWGGWFKLWPESASLLDNYILENAQLQNISFQIRPTPDRVIDPMRINSGIYENSVIVRYAINEMKTEINKRLANGVNPVVLNSTQVLTRKNFGDPGEMGQIMPGGVLLAEQNNERLKYANNRFILRSTTVIEHPSSGGNQNGNKKTTWRVEDPWDYASFEEQINPLDDVTEIPIPKSGGKKLRLPDGLSHYMITLGIAKSFIYFSEWEEQW